MASGAVLSYRNDLEEKLNAKRSELQETEETLKKYVGDVATRPSFRGRLGPPPQRDNVQARLSLDGQQRRQPIVGRGRLSLEGRLGPKVNEEEEEEEVDEGRKVMSRVVVEQKSREEALKEKKADKAEVQRSKRMFGNLLGTLQRFRQDENKVKERELKKREIEQKIEEKTEKEKDEAKKKKQELFTDFDKQRQQYRILQAQLRRVQEFDKWEKNKRLEAKFIRTKKSPHIYYLPKEHNDVTMTALEETIDLVEEEIKAARIKFDEEMKKMTDMMDNPTQDANLEEDEQENDGKNLSSVVSAVQKPDQKKRSPSPPTNRRQRRKSSQSPLSEDERDEKKEKIKDEQKQAEETKKVETEEKNVKETDIRKEEKIENGAEAEKTKSAERMSPKSERRSTKSGSKKSSSRGQRKRSASSSSSSSESGSSSSSSSDSSSTSDSSDDESRKKKKNGPSKKRTRRGSSSD